MRKPSETALLSAFPQLDNYKAGMIRRLCDLRDSDILLDYIATYCLETHVYAMQCYHSPYDSTMWRNTMVLHAIDRIMGTYGVEGLGPVSMREGPPYEYCNTGDPYGRTLIYKRASDNLYIGRWATIAERHPKW